VARFLAAQPEVAWVRYPDLESDRYHALAQKYMPGGTCGVLTFGLKGGRDRSVAFIDALKFVSIVTHVADARSCVLHPASHTHRQLSDGQLAAAGVPADLIRLSVGIEDVDDILDDLRQALQKI
jgi:O-acetylhomoserine (thiol)-lyase